MRLALLVVLGGCSYHPPSGPSSDAPTGRTITIVDDTAADFADPAELLDGVIALEGLIEPHAYALGGLHARAYAGKLFDGTITSFADVDAAIAAQTPLGEGYGQLPDDWKSARPFGLVLGIDDDFTIVYDGEVALVAGENKIEIDGDDLAAIEVTIDNTPTFLVDATAGAKAVLVTAPVAGFYPFRAAIGESTGNAKLALRLGTSIGVNPALAPQLRSRVASTGLTAHVYDLAHSQLFGTTVVASADADFGQLPPPYDLPTPAPTGNYSVRFVGQIHIDVAGSWQFEATRTDPDVSRVWVDEQHVASSWPNAFSDGTPTVGTIDLAVGWHDIFVDLSVRQIDPTTGIVQRHNATINLVATPPGGTPGPVARSQLRPVVSSGLALGIITPPQPLQIDDITNISLTLPASPFNIHSLDIGYSIEKADTADYTVVLDDGTGTIIPIPPGSDTAGLVFDNLLLRGQPAPKIDWTLRFTDNVVGGLANPAVRFTFVDLICRGGPATPFSPIVTFTSKPRETPNAIALGAVRVRGSLDEAVLAISVRTAADAAGLDAAPWVTVLEGEVPDATPGAVIQYRIETKSDGWQFPVIDAVELDYVVPE